MNQHIARAAFLAVQKLRGWEHRSILSELEALQWLPRERVDAYRHERLRRLLTHCHQEVPFYREQFAALGVTRDDLQSPDVLKRLPKLTKSVIRANYAQFSPVSGGEKWEAWTSSGSTGEPFPFRLSKQAIAANTFAALARGRRWWDLDFGVREAMIWSGIRDVSGSWRGRISALKRRVSWGLKNAKLVDVYHIDETSVRAAYHTFRKFQPQLFRSIASGLYRFCATLEQLGLDGKQLNARAAIYTGEGLLRSQRELIERVLGCKTVSEYGCTELGVIAFECPSGGLHLTHENHIFEFEKDGREAKPGEQAELVVTNLNNFAAPLVRYVVGDIVVPSDGACACGRTMPLISAVEGRTHHTIRTPGGKAVHALFFTHIFDTVPAIHQFRIVQESLDRLRVEILGHGKVTERDIDFVRAAGERAMGPGVTVQVVEVTEIAAGAGGKQPWIISLLERPSTRQQSR